MTLKLVFLIRKKLEVMQQNMTTKLNLTKGITNKNKAMTLKLVFLIRKKLEVMKQKMTKKLNKTKGITKNKNLLKTLKTMKRMAKML